MENKIIVVGDIHLRDKNPYYDQAIEILNSIFDNREYNNEKNTLLFLGDLIEKINASFEIVQVYVDLFMNKSKFKMIKILKGNHDSALLKDSNGVITHSTVLSVFTPFSNVEIIDSWKMEKVDNISLLYLPHYDHEGTDKKPLTIVYSELYKELEDKSFDYGFTHVEDETNHFSSKYCDLSKLKVKQYLNGHIHTENVTKGGRFLGSPGFNSYSEKDKTPYIAIIDTNTKDYELIEMPKNIEYIEVNYPDNIPEKKSSKFEVFTVFESIDKQETLNFYSKQRSPFYCRKVYSKKTKAVELITDSEYKEKSILEHFNSYKEANKVKDSIADICRNILEKVVETA